MIWWRIKFTLFAQAKMPISYRFWWHASAQWRIAENYTPKEAAYAEIRHIKRSNV